MDLAATHPSMDAIVPVQQATNTLCQIFRYDDVVLFYPVLPCLQEELTIIEKSLESTAATKFVQAIVRRELPLYNVIVRNGKDIGVTYQGFANTLIRTLALRGLSFNIQDLRVATIASGNFPAPQFNRMHGFRFSQESLVRNLLSADMSGLLGAPTRFGKTAMLINTLRAYPDLVTVVTAPGVDLVQQLYADITDKARGIRDREVKLICTGSRARTPSDTGITVCSMDSLDKCDYGATELLLVDEPHAAVTNSRLSTIDKFTKARRYGFGATLQGRFDGRDKLITGLFGPVITERTFLEAVDEGAICMLHIIFLEVQIEPANYYDRNAAYNGLLFLNPDMAALTARICSQVIPEDWQTLIFIKHEKQAELYIEELGTEHTIAMAKRLNKTQRKEVDARMKSNDIKRCLCSKIYVQGVTFSDVRVLINAEAGGNNTSAIQKPGRLAEIRPGKACGIVIDFLFVPPDGVKLSDYRGEAWTNLCQDSNSRRKAYTDKGYGIHVVSSVNELKDTFNKLAY